MSAHISYDHDRDGALSTARLDASLYHFSGRSFRVGSTAYLRSDPFKPMSEDELDNEELVSSF